MKLPLFGRLKLVQRSPPARGAGIETSYEQAMEWLSKKSPPARGAGIETVVSTENRVIRSVAPCAGGGD